MTVKEAGEKWGLGTRIVTLYCVEGRIPGALKKGNLWLIPADAARPADKRRKQAPPQKSQARWQRHFVRSQSRIRVYGEYHPVRTVDANPIHDYL